MTRFLAEQLSHRPLVRPAPDPRLLGWTPRVGIDAGLAALAAEM